MNAMALRQAGLMQSLHGEGTALRIHGEKAAVLDTAGGLRRCKADSLRLAAVGLPALHSRGVKLGAFVFGVAFLRSTFVFEVGGGR